MTIKSALLLSLSTATMSDRLLLLLLLLSLLLGRVALVKGVAAYSRQTFP